MVRASHDVTDITHIESQVPVNAIYIVEGLGRCWFRESKIVRADWGLLIPIKQHSSCCKAGKNGHFLIVSFMQ